MTTTNFIGLEQQGAEALANQLNQLLANFQIQYQNLRGLHWNIRGNNFFDLHVKFEEFYLDAQTKIDLVAERVLTLGATPLHTFADYLSAAQIEPAKNVGTDEASVQTVLDGLQVLIAQERTILSDAAELGDEGTITLISDFISEQEKTTWMLAAWLNR